MKEEHAVRLQPTAHPRSRYWLALAVGACLSTLIAGAAGGAPAQAAGISNGGSQALSRATDLGRVSSSSPIELTVWLELRDGAGLESALSAPHVGGAGYLSDEQIDKLHAPAAASVSAVSSFLKTQGLTITGVGPHNFYIKAAGSAATVESAFRVQLHQYSFNGRTFRASAVKPTLPSGIASLVSSVGGLNTLGPSPNIAQPRVANSNIVRPSDGEALPAQSVPLASAGANPNGLVFAAQCFYPPTTVSFSGGGVSATYSGAVYGASISNTAIGTLAPCGYQPSDLQTAYNMTPLYNVGLDGTGQTIAIVDAFGSTTVAADLATFSAVMGLPPANLQIIGTSTESNFSTDMNAGWATETTLDVEWVHAIAPGAKILLVVAPTNSFDDLFAAIVTAAQQPGVVAISNSWSGLESFTDVPLRTAGDAILKVVAAKGVAANFASGDSGNETINLGYADVDYPASSPFATAVGGVSVALDQSKHILFQTSWGNTITRLADRVRLGSPPTDPPLNEGFQFGGGGGMSNVYPLPRFQHSLGSPRRMLPDVSWVADPFTGVEIIFTADAAGDQAITVIGGTSLATPMFSGLWGIAAQRAHHALGQAAPYLYNLPQGAIIDVVPPGFVFTNVTGTLTDANGQQSLTPSVLASPLQNNASFVSALYNSPFSTRWFVLSFGVDSTLTTAPGWDAATGVGTPNGVAFVQAFGQDAQ
jgi:subtilase family serine protease